MAIFKAPRINSADRGTLVLQESELVYDTDQSAFYGGNNVTVGGFLIGSNAGFKYERIQLTNQNIIDKFVVLPDTPLVPSSVFLTIEQGIPQTNGIDYTVTGNVLSWDGLGLDNFLDNTDVLLVLY